MFSPLRQATLVGILGSALFTVGSSYAACGPADINGAAMPSGTSAARTIVLTPTTPSVDVNYGETVKIVMLDGQELIWKFDGLSEKLTLATLTASASASQGTSAAGSSGSRDVPVYVNQSKSPLRHMHPACLGF